MPAQTPDLVAPKSDLAFLHQSRAALPGPLEAIEVWQLLFARPLPGLRAAMRLRDAVAGAFGIRPIQGFSHRPVPGTPKPGDRLDFFTVERSDPDRLTLTARDSHLDVMVSTLISGGEVSITTSVRTHNALGRAYMLPVGPAHRLILWAMMRRLRRALARPA